MTTSKTSSVDIATVSNDESLTDFELVERMHRIEEKRQELAKQREREEIRRDPDIRYKEYRAAHNFCHPRCGFICDKRDEASWISHISQCGWKIEQRQQTEKELQLARTGHQKMGFTLGMIEKCKQDIKNLKQKIQREKKEKKENYQFVVRMSEAKIGEIKTRLEKEEIEKQKLLNDENEIVRSAAREVLERYNQASEYDRSRDQY